MADPFIEAYQPSDLRVAAEFLSNWLPFLSKDLCDRCSSSLRDRIRSLDPESVDEEPSTITTDDCVDCGNNSPTSTRQLTPAIDSSGGCSISRSWADECDDVDDGEGADEGLGEDSMAVEAKRAGETPLSREQRENIRLRNVARKKDFVYWERVRGREVNIVGGLELHTGVFSAAEQQRIVDFVYKLQELGRKGELKDRTYSEPQKWMRGKGRVTIQFGCCYNYATDKKGNPPGIIRNEDSDSMPSLFKVMIKRLVKWHVLPPTCIPDSCIVNIYEPGDCIPPHIDHHDFVRPFCTVSFLSECDILFGSNLKIAGPGDFSGPMTIFLPVGSVLVMKGNGADVAKHCVPAVPTKRISITFRRMDDRKRPIGFQPEPDLQHIQPLDYDSDSPKNLQFLERNTPASQRTPVGNTNLNSEKEPYSSSPNTDGTQSTNGTRSKTPWNVSGNQGLRPPEEEYPALQGRTSTNSNGDWEPRRGRPRSERASFRSGERLVVSTNLEGRGRVVDRSVHVEQTPSVRTWRRGRIGLNS
ncbi:hypothetical protein QJS10_CPB11g00810 [Acorus calamus]|uniref:Fe2OG dioxygenase domain-containing protein n=1 Tax=Acorus calamus TaxID=4465 RepID=A0AAV9DTU6_ACOCL|nr:hypothetical protein QJS10_CPB11g00810 [Acorus calamus]